MNPAQAYDSLIVLAFDKLIIVMIWLQISLHCLINFMLLQNFWK